VKEETVLLLCLTSVLHLGWPYQEYKTPVNIPIRVTEVRNPPRLRKGDSTRGVEKKALRPNNAKMLYMDENRNSSQHS